MQIRGSTNCVRAAALAGIIPTLIELMGMEQPKEMTAEKARL
ncbi:MAG: hypothetical protein ACLTSZ_03895 [Lachnospiraceae bacterium]